MMIEEIYDALIEAGASEANQLLFTPRPDFPRAVGASLVP
jgi:hypothetical protein